MGAESLMQENTFIVVDNDYRNRNELTMALGKIGYVVPADSLDDLGGRWPEEAWVCLRGTVLAWRRLCWHWPDALIRPPSTLCVFLRCLLDCMPLNVFFYVLTN